jgi:hypothetical protein
MNCIFRVPNDEGMGEWRRGQKVEMPSETKRVNINGNEFKLINKVIHNCN